MVIYDPARRYHNLALALDTPQCRVIDAGPSTIEAREAAMRALRDLTEGKIHQLIVWLPTRKPESDEDRQGDPFSVLRRIGAEFPGRRRTHKYSNRAAELPPIQASDDGSWTCPSPVGQDHDWILILEPKAIAK